MQSDAPTGYGSHPDRAQTGTSGHAGAARAKGGYIPSPPTHQKLKIPMPPKKMSLDVEVC